MKSFADIFVGIIVPFSTVIPLVIGLLFFRKKDLSIRLVLTFLAVSLLTNTVASIVASYNINNLPGLHLYTLVEGILLILFFRQCVKAGWVRKWCLVFLVLFPLVCVVDVLFFHSIYQFNSYSRPVESIILVVLAMAYLSEQIGRERKTAVERARFWIVIGVLVYFSASFFQFLFSNVLHVTAEKHIRLMIWNLHAGFVLIMYTMITIGLTKLKHDR